GCSASPPPEPSYNPSTVVTSCPSAWTANNKQARTASPSSSTVQAPHTPCSHPTCVPRAVDGDHQRHAQGPQRYALAGSAARRQNSSMKRREALAKLTGRERYVDDLPLDNFLWGMTVRSPAARGRVAAIRFGNDIDWSQFVVVDHRDIPGPNVVSLIEQDQPVLAAGYVRHVHEPVLLVAHPSREAVRRAVRSVEVVVEPEPPALDFRITPTPEWIQYGADNVLKHLQIVK